MVGVAKRARPRPLHPEGTLGIELRAHTLSLCPNLVLSLAEAQLLSGSSSRSPTRQARRLVLKANCCGAVRTVLEPGPLVSLAYEADDGCVYCMETSFTDCPTRRLNGERLATQILSDALEARLLDDKGRIEATADVVAAFKIGVIRVSCWLTCGHSLSCGEAEAAAKNRDLKVRVWACEKPNQARSAFL
jgi:hypothetical protein